MAQDSSVAPKERVNIRFKPATGDAKQEIELPHKLLVLGDFTGRPDETPVAERSRINVNKDNFNDVMRSQKLNLELKVANRLADGPEAGTLDVALPVATLKDMEPEAIARAVPELRKLLELREALTALKGPLGNVPAFRKAIEGVLGDAAARDKLRAELGGGKGE
jgi:type VI secretion system protein ImpB